MRKTIIDNLNERKSYVPFKAGGEGTAFLFENYVLKRYHPFEYWNKEAFANYFKELQYFCREKCDIPRTIAWKAESKDECYLLQERLSTKEIYPTGMKSSLTLRGKTEILDVSPLKYIFAECEGFCSREEFNAAVDKADPNDPLYTMIVMTYLNIFVSTNKKLESLEGKVLDKFIFDDALMTIYGKYGVPDIHAGNVFFDKNTNNVKQIQIIDNFFLNGFDNPCYQDEAKTGNSVYTDMFRLFRLNGELQDIISKFEGKKLSDMQKIIDENLKLAEKTLLRFVDVSKKIIRPGTQLDKRERYTCTTVAQSISGKYGKLSREIDRQFGME